MCMPDRQPSRPQHAAAYMRAPTTSRAYLRNRGSWLAPCSGSLSCYWRACRRRCRCLRLLRRVGQDLAAPTRFIALPLDREEVASGVQLGSKRLPVNGMSVVQTTVHGAARVPTHAGIAELARVPTLACFSATCTSRMRLASTCRQGRRRARMMLDRGVRLSQHGGGSSSSSRSTCARRKNTRRGKPALGP
jgi:hypothetical protein